MDIRSIESSVKGVLNFIGYADQDCLVDIANVAKQLGFLVGNAKLGQEEDGFIIVDEGRSSILGFNTDKLIGVNSERTIDWKRFIIAHELGHYILHFKEKNFKGLYVHLDSKNECLDAEDSADYFATSLLMPMNSFVENYNRLQEAKLPYEEILLVLASRFCVNKTLVEVRIQEIESAWGCSGV